MRRETNGLPMITFALIPGLLSDARVWRPLGEALAAHGAVRAADLRGMTSITGAAEAILAAVPGPIVPVGHSMGGRIAMEIARLAPGRVRGLVLADTGHHPRREAEMPKRHELIALGHAGMDRLADAWLPPMVAPAARGDAALMGDLRTMVLGFDAETHERQIRALIGRPDAFPHLAAIACPVLLIVGTEDGWSPEAQHREIAGALADAEVVVIPGAGHFAPIEAPGPVTAATLDWIARKLEPAHG
jgi:pimeloyl-ACP methyl ester carboxylesterase